jgi:hypothetical protein
MPLDCETSDSHGAVCVEVLKLFSVTEFNKVFTGRQLRRGVKILQRFRD